MGTVAGQARPGHQGQSSQEGGHLRSSCLDGFWPVWVRIREHVREERGERGEERRERRVERDDRKERREERGERRDERGERREE